MLVDLSRHELQTRAARQSNIRLLDSNKDYGVCSNDSTIKHWICPFSFKGD